MTVSSAEVILAAGFWDTQSGDPATAPGSGKYQADNWASPALLAISAQDADGYARQDGLAAILPGDLITEQGTNNSQNYQRWTVVTVTDNAYWVQVGVTVAETGSAFAAPGSNQRRLLQVIRAGGAAPPEVAPVLDWHMWAPPLDPPTAGGLDAATAEAIAAATWATDPHLCAALQWEAYAATLPPSPSVAQVSTGAQSVAYSPPMPGGDYGAAMARAAWHRSLMGSATSVELTQAAPALQSAPGSPWASGAGSPAQGAYLWWEVAP